MSEPEIIRLRHGSLALLGSAKHLRPKCAQSSRRERDIARNVAAVDLAEQVSTEIRESSRIDAKHHEVPLIDNKMPYSAVTVHGSIAASRRCDNAKDFAQREAEQRKRIA